MTPLIHPDTIDWIERHHPGQSTREIAVRQLVAECRRLAQVVADQEREPIRPTRTVEQTSFEHTLRNHRTAAEPRTSTSPRG